MLRATIHEREIRKAIGLPSEGDQVLDGIATLDANEDRCLYFVDHQISDVIRESLATRDGCIVIAPKGSELTGALGQCRVLEALRPRTAIAKVLTFISAQQRQEPWVSVRNIAQSAKVSPLAVIEGNVEIAENVVIEPFCTVGPDVKIGRGSILRAGARINPRVSIAEESIIGQNAVVGSEGFGFVRDDAGNKMRIPHLGGVIIGSRVEIGALSVVQAGTLSSTIIHDYAKIDDNVEIGHNVRVGRNVSIIGGVVVGGSAIVETEAWIGMNSSIRNGRRVGSRVLIGMDVSAQSDLPDNTVARAPRPDVRMRDDNDVTTIGFVPKSQRKNSPK